LQSIETMDDGAARIRPRRCSSVELSFYPRSETVVGGRVWTRRSGRWHGAGAELLHHFFPDLSIVRHAFDTQFVERQSGGLELIVVTSNAVPGEQREMRGTRLGGGRG